MTTAKDHRDEVAAARAQLDEVAIVSEAATRRLISAYYMYNRYGPRFCPALKQVKADIHAVAQAQDRAVANLNSARKAQEDYFHAFILP